MERIGFKNLHRKNRKVSFVRRLLTILLATALFHDMGARLNACGPSYLEPVFVFKGSPDIPFEEFTSGNVGIIRPTFGRKSLVIAYRYISGGGYSVAEQQFLIQALRGDPPEQGDEREAVKAWLETRKRILPDDKVPDIYTERTNGGYNFFPNCTKNAFEVASQTLNDRASTYGADDLDVRDWLAAQDRVFDICSSGTTLPPELGVEAPLWLKKDRDYQIGAAHFYSLDFEEALHRFKQIAEDGESPWQDIADYLVGRTLVRQGSLTKNEARSRVVYEQAEQHLESLVRKGGKLSRAAEELLGLIKYRIRPEERVAELAKTLAYTSSNDNLRQDLIDYSWLIDKFEGQVLNEIRDRKAKELREQDAARRPVISASTNSTAISRPDGPQEMGSAINANVRSDGSVPSAWEKERDAIRKGKIISVGLTHQLPGKEYPENTTEVFDPDVTDAEVIEAFRSRLGRDITTDESKSILADKATALAGRREYLGANFRFTEGRSESTGRDYYGDEELTTGAVPDFLRREDLTDWVLSFQIDDDQAYTHALSRWQEMKSPAWLLAALTKAKKDSPGIQRLIGEGQKMPRSMAAYPTVAYHIARLEIDLGKRDEARMLLDEISNSSFSMLPVSSQNLFLELRLGVARTLGEFLTFAGRKPVTFSNGGSSYGNLRDFLEQEKSYWNPEYDKQTREEFIRDTEERYRDLLPLDGRVLFDERTADIFNRHFPVDLLAQAAVAPELPDHMRGPLAELVWTRSVLLERRDLIPKASAEVMRLRPDLAEAFRAYLSIKTLSAKRNEELWILITNPRLTAFIKSGIPPRDNEVSSWQDGWWYEPSDTDYDNKGNELPKRVARPGFISAQQSADARKERQRIFAAGDAERYLSARVFEWAKESPRDARLAEALYIVATINLPTKYGSGNQDVRNKAIGMLEDRYAKTPWLAKAKEDDY